MKNFGRLSIAALMIAGTIAYVGCESPDETVSNGIDVVENEVDRIDGGGTTQNKFVIASFGHPSVVGAKEDPAAQISSFRMSGRSGCSWSYKTDVGAAWGVGKDTIGLITVAGYLRSDGQWVCGKFDWARPSNRTRDFKNINDHYNGWDPEAFYAAKKHCFFLMSENGKKRTNIITD